MPHWDWTTAAGPPGSRDLGAGPPHDRRGAAGGAARRRRTGALRETHQAAVSATRPQSMRFAFDLWAYDGRRAHAAAILERLRTGTMPCDGAWPPARIDALQRWADTGQAP